MHVKLISITQPSLSIACPVNKDGPTTAEELITYCARVSNPNNQNNHETAPGLIKYLIKNKHWSPFEMVSMCVEIQTSRAIAQQILRHRSFSFQEFSQRYASPTVLEPIEFRHQAEKNRQSSSDVYELGELSQMAVDECQQAALDLYNELIKIGVARESARFVLPLNMQTTLYMSGTVRSWIHYLQLRSDEHTQKEHRDIANEIKNIFDEEFPNIAEAL